MNTLRYTYFMLDSPNYTFADFPTWCISCAECIFFCKRPIHYFISTRVLNISWDDFRGLTIQNSHLSGNVIQCNPRRKHMRTRWQHHYKLLHSYMDYCCIRWCLQEQNHIYKYMKKHKHNVHTVVSFYYSGFSCSRTKTDRILWDDLC